MAQLDELILEGAVPKSVVDSHRKVKDIRLDFIVMQLDVEERIFEIQRQKQIQTSLRRMA